MTSQYFSRAKFHRVPQNCLHRHRPRLFLNMFAPPLAHHDSSPRANTNTHNASSTMHHPLSIPRRTHHLFHRRQPRFQCTTHIFRYTLQPAAVGSEFPLPLRRARTHAVTVTNKLPRDSSPTRQRMLAPRSLIQPMRHQRE